MEARRLFDLTGQVAAVTGAASGLGLAFAEVLAANGARVVLLDVDAAGLRAAPIDGAEKEVLDAGDAGAVTRCIDSIAARHGRLDIMFANAGISAGPGFGLSEAGRIEAAALDNWENVLRVNLTGVFATMQAAARHMKARRYGRIIVTASIAGLRAEANCGYAYAATKAAVINLVRQAALDLAPDNVLVNAIAPGPFLTNIAGGRLKSDPERAKSFADTVPLGRIAHTDEIKGLALLLASPASSFITGTVIPIDGGSTAG